MSYLIEQEAKFHKVCKNQYDDYHFKRASKRRKTDDSTSETPSSQSHYETRSHFCAENFKPICFFCDKDDNDNPLHQVRTLGLDKQVREAAELLLDEKLLAKLSEGDLVATEARYHKSCLNAVNNKARAKKR